MSELTAELLRSLLNYDPATGEFSWKVRCGMRGLPGKVTGHTRGEYRQITVRQKNYRAHRLAWLHHYGRWPKGEIDHIDGDKHNNAITNLREVTLTVNQRNRSLPSNNTSGVIGVCWHKGSERWHASIGAKYVGSFRNLSDAKAARRRAEREHGYHENHGRSAA